MEIRQKLIDCQEAMPGTNKNIRESTSGGNRLGSAASRHRFLSGVLERANNRGTYSQNRPVLVASGCYRRRCTLRNLIGLRMHNMIVQNLRANGLKGAETNLERDLSDLDSLLAQFGENRGREMKACRWCRNCGRMFCKYRLIALSI